MNAIDALYAWDRTRSESETEGERPALGAIAAPRPVMKLESEA